MINRNESRISRQSSKPTTPRTAPARARGRSATDLRSRMEDLGVDMEGTEEVIIYNVNCISRTKLIFYRLILQKHVDVLVH